ncbi:MAG: ATP-binding protein [Chloroflexota bacterium]
MRPLSVLRAYLNAGLPPRIRDLFAVGVIVITAILGLSAFRTGAPDEGITFYLGPDRMVVADISPWGAAAQSSLRPGMVVLRINQSSVSPIASDRDQPVRQSEEWPAIVAERLDYVEAISVADYDQALASGSDPPLTAVHAYLATPGSIEESWPSVVVGLALLAGVWWWLLGYCAAPVRGLAGAASAAITVPLFLLPFALTWGRDTLLLLAVILPLASLPLADGLSGLLPATERHAARALLLTAVLVAVGVGILLVQTGSGGPATLVSVGMAAAVPIISAASLSRNDSKTRFNNGGMTLAPLELAALSLTPLFGLIALGFHSTSLLWLLVFWVIVLAAAQRFSIAPLNRTVATTRLQRDLVVEATEAERARIATDLHDVALQELTMLAMRLDAKGDEESADAAREVADRVREICGDLRLPLLDDFGVGPALAWLVDRLDQATPARITLAQNDAGRLPPEVELAIFRVAQEALGNAVRHGIPPIVVRFQAGSGRASLSIDDAGPGIGPDAVQGAQQAGRFGLLNMQQRAEQVGALLDVRRWPGGGTHVALEWRAP